MALKMDYIKDVYGQDQTFTDTYIRVRRIIEYSKEEGITLDVEIYRSEILTDNKNIINSMGYNFPYNPNNKEDALAECYAYLKKLPEFKDSIDC